MGPRHTNVCKISRLWEAESSLVRRIFPNLSKVEKNLERSIDSIQFKDYEADEALLKKKNKKQKTKRVSWHKNLRISEHNIKAWSAVHMTTFRLHCFSQEQVTQSTEALAIDALRVWAGQIVPRHICGTLGVHSRNSWWVELHLTQGTKPSFSLHS